MCIRDRSIHKTLMGMTQTAVLHVSNEAVSSKRVDIGKLEYYLRVYQSSSPSYVLMASVDECVRFLENKERKCVLFNKYLDRLKLIHNTSKKWKDIHIFLPEAQDLSLIHIYTYINDMRVKRYFAPHLISSNCAAVKQLLQF